MYAPPRSRPPSPAGGEHRLGVPAGLKDADIPALVGLPGFDSYLNGLDKDHDATVAGLTLPHSNGPTEGVNTRVKYLKRQMFGRAGFPLLRKRILLI